MCELFRFYLNIFLKDKICFPVKEHKGRPFVPLFEKKIPAFMRLVERGAEDQALLRGEARDEGDVLVKVVTVDSLLKGQGQKWARGVTVHDLG